MNQRTRIKICGVRTPQIAEAAADAGADAIGLVFEPRSPRCVTFEEAASVAAAVPAFVTAVGLFVDPRFPDERIEQAVIRGGVRALQLHGDADQAAIGYHPTPVILTAAFDTTTIVESLRRAQRLADEFSHIAGLVVDAPDPSKIGGGTGRAFDWSLLRAALDDAQPRLPIILAGGLTPDNVAQAIAAVRPHAVDVSSGVESQRGVKDAGMIRAFCQAVCQADRHRV